MEACREPAGKACLGRNSMAGLDWTEQLVFQICRGDQINSLGDTRPSTAAGVLLRRSAVTKDTGEIFAQISTQPKIVQQVKKFSFCRRV